MYVDSHDDEYYRERLLKLLSNQECMRSQMYRAFGAKIKAEQLTRVLESLREEGKISSRRLQFVETGHYTQCEAWGLFDHPKQIEDREEKQRKKQAEIDRAEAYWAAEYAKETKRHWRDFWDEALVLHSPEDVYAKLHRLLHRSQRSPAWRKEQIIKPWLHSISLFP